MLQAIELRADTCVCLMQGDIWHDCVFANNAIILCASCVFNLEASVNLRSTSGMKPADNSMKFYSGMLNMTGIYWHMTTSRMLVYKLLQSTKFLQRSIPLYAYISNGLEI